MEVSDERLAALIEHGMRYTAFQPTGSDEQKEAREMLVCLWELQAYRKAFPRPEPAQ